MNNCEVIKREMRDNDFLPRQQCASLLRFHCLNVISPWFGCRNLQLPVSHNRVNKSLTQHSSADDKAALLFICVLIKFCHVTVRYKDSVVGNGWILKAWVAVCLSSSLLWRTQVSHYCRTRDWPNLCLRITLAWVELVWTAEMASSSVIHSD